jgi:hypothetical protein
VSAMTVHTLPSEILTRAAVILTERGWTQGDWSNPTGTDQPCSVCILAALNLAAGRDADDRINGLVADAADAVAAILGLDHLVADAIDLHDTFVDVLGAGWNDDHGRTANEVIRVLRAAAVSEREAGR